MSDYYDSDDFDPIEGYCVRCKESVEMENAVGVWTRKGMPATRGECPICGGTVFRMGKTHLHAASERPEAVEIGDTGGKRKQPRLTKDTVYVNYAEADEAFAQRIADDLNNAGVAAWLHTNDAGVNWASGVHPALNDCDRMVFVLSPQSLLADDVTAGWQFFRERRKPIVIASVAPADPPDTIRRSPRFKFDEDYKVAFRQMIQALSS